MSASTTPFLYSDLALDPDLAEIVQMFVDEMPERIERLVRCYDQNDLENLGRAAHQLKGSAGSYGFMPITPAAAKLEHAVRSQQGEAAIEASLLDLLTLCKQIRGGVPSENA